MRALAPRGTKEDGDSPQARSAAPPRRGWPPVWCAWLAQLLLVAALEQASKGTQLPTRTCGGLGVVDAIGHVVQVAVIEDATAVLQGQRWQA